ncbi:hypothetical protein ENH_00032180 [Eimeria necatrix]|uniref:Uncharacterized protein n=1 Tax=Eimeria necatrix TaxID=51315 RepID=U6MSL7_9EIME|nr:hypothetical protein ENH_00032180 [Eimeria necatrix]CDJ67197.1 hypothetical protein ENH_00032180 [Eimeria necatrix]
MGPPGAPPGGPRGPPRGPRGPPGGPRGPFESEKKYLELRMCSKVGEDLGALHGGQFAAAEGLEENLLGGISPIRKGGLEQGQVVSAYGHEGLEAPGVKANTSKGRAGDEGPGPLGLQGSSSGAPAVQQQQQQQRQQQQQQRQQRGSDS